MRLDSKNLPRRSARISAASPRTLTIGNHGSSLCNARQETTQVCAVPPGTSAPSARCYHVQKWAVPPGTSAKSAHCCHVQNWRVPRSNVTSSRHRELLLLRSDSHRASRPLDGLVSLRRMKACKITIHFSRARRPRASRLIRHTSHIHQTLGKHTLRGKRRGRVAALAIVQRRHLARICSQHHRLDPQRRSRSTVKARNGPEGHSSRWSAALRPCQSMRWAGRSRHQKASV